MVYRRLNAQKENSLKSIRFGMYAKSLVSFDYYGWCVKFIRVSEYQR